MRRRLPLRRFPNEVVRQREGPGSRNDFGKWVPGQIVRTILPALVQPISLEDNNLTGGVQLSERLTVHVPVGVQRTIAAGDSLRWNGAELLWNNAPLSWGRAAGEVIPGDENPLAAAFEDRAADHAEFAGAVYVVEKSQLWAWSHTRAILLRQT